MYAVAEHPFKIPACLAKRTAVLTGLKDILVQDVPCTTRYENPCCFFLNTPHNSSLLVENAVATEIPYTQLIGTPPLWAKEEHSIKTRGYRTNRCSSALSVRDVYCFATSLLHQCSRFLRARSDLVLLYHKENCCFESQIRVTCGDSRRTVQRRRAGIAELSTDGVVTAFRRAICLWATRVGKDVVEKTEAAISCVPPRGRFHQTEGCALGSSCGRSRSPLRSIMGKSYQEKKQLHRYLVRDNPSTQQSYMIHNLSPQCLQEVYHHTHREPDGWGSGETTKVEGIWFPVKRNRSDWDERMYDHSSGHGLALENVELNSINSQGSYSPTTPESRSTLSGLTEGKTPLSSFSGSVASAEDVDNNVRSMHWN